MARRFKRIKIGREVYYRIQLPDGTYWQLRQAGNRQWFVGRYQPLGKHCKMLSEAASPTPYQFIRQDGTVIDESSREDSRKWSLQRAKTWAYAFIRGEDCVEQRTR